MEHNQKVEDYMRIIYRLRENGLVRGAYIARERNGSGGLLGYSA